MAKINAVATGTPRGLWIWKLAKLRPDYLQALEEKNCQRVYLKVFDDLHGASFWDFQCSKNIIKAFRDRGISVVGWGYHFDQRTSIDVAEEVAAVGKAMSCGLEGYIFDVEAEIESPAAKKPLEALLTEIRAVMDTKFVGYSSFGHPGKHPRVPWSLLDSLTDIAFPQIYFEKWTFGGSDEQEVQSALAAHEDANLKNPILPVWGSEEDAEHPANAATLQEYLRRFRGSSIFRAPHVGQRGQAWNLNYGSDALPIFTFEAKAKDYTLPDFKQRLREGHRGRAVSLTQRALAARGFDPGQISGRFSASTRRAVKQFQWQNELNPTGTVGPRTWTALGGRLPTKSTRGVAVSFSSNDRDHLAAIAETEGAKGLAWTGPQSEAEKYLQPLRKPMQDIGDIGSKPVFYNWCAAFVRYCARQAGYAVPDIPPGHSSTMALVEMWKAWGKDNGWWYPGVSVQLLRGDIVCFEWSDGDASLDHIGIVRNYSVASTMIETAEGNRNNRTANGTRRTTTIGGIVRLS
jgi:hypothetical protein